MKVMLKQALVTLGTVIVALAIYDRVVAPMIDKTVD